MRSMPGLLLSCCSVLLLAACAPATLGESGSTAPAAAQDIQVQVQPQTVDLVAQGTVTLTATVFGTTDQRVAWLVVEPEGGTVDGSGRYSAPATPGVYHVSARSIADGNATASALVTVSATGTQPSPVPPPPAPSPAPPSPVPPPAAPLPSIAALAASPTAITAGQATTLSWSVTDATSLSISPGVGTVTGNSVSVRPTATTTYALLATNASGSVSRTVTVTVSAGSTYDGTLLSDLKILKSAAPIFVHKSIGDNVMTGLQAIIDETCTTPSDCPTIRRYRSDGSDGPYTAQVGVFTHVYLVEENDRIAEKLAAWQAVMDTPSVNGVATLSMFKFCTGDLDSDTQGNESSRWDPYRQKLESLKAQYPSVTFVGFTAPVMAGDEAGADWSRNAYRLDYALPYFQSGTHGEWFDVAWYESKLGATHGSGGALGLDASYAVNDGLVGDATHPNLAGSKAVATALVRKLAAITRAKAP